MIDCVALLNYLCPLSALWPLLLCHTVQSTFALNDSGSRNAFFLLIISICCPCSVIVLLNHRHMDDQANDRHFIFIWSTRSIGAIRWLCDIASIHSLQTKPKLFWFTCRSLFVCVCSLRCFPYLDKSIKVFYIPIKWITFCPTRIRTTLIRIVQKLHMSR